MRGMVLRAVFAAALGWSAAIQASDDALIPVLEYELAPGEAAHMGTALVQVFSDGRVLLQRPAYWKQPGTYEQRLTEAELATLLTRATALGFAELSPEALEQAQEESLSAKQVLMEVQDADRISINVRTGGLDETVVVTAPSARLAVLPQVQALSSLVRLDRDFRRLLSAAPDGKARRLAEGELP